MPEKTKPTAKAAFRDRLCEAALKIFVKEGLENLTMRRLAKELGISAMTAYNYFEDRNEIVQEVLDRAYDEFASSQKGAIDHFAEPMENLMKLDEAYFQFAMDHPLQYSALFMIQNERLEQSKERRSEAFLPLLDTVTQLVETDVLEGEPVLIANLLWSGRHGLISLDFAKRFMNDLSSKLEEMISEMNERLLKSFMKMDKSGI